MKKVLIFLHSYVIILWQSENCFALIAQLDRVTGYEPVGRGFESLSARQSYSDRREM